MTTNTIPLDIPTPDALKMFFGKTIHMNISYSLLRRMMIGTSSAVRELLSHLKSQALQIISKHPFYTTPAADKERAFAVILKRENDIFHIKAMPKYLDSSHSHISNGDFALKILYYASSLKADERLFFNERTLSFNLMDELQEVMIKTAVTKVASIILPESPEKDALLNDINQSSNFIAEVTDRADITQPAVKAHLEYELPPLLASLLPKAHTFQFPAYPCDIGASLGDKESIYRTEFMLMLHILQESDTQLTNKIKPSAERPYVNIKPDDIAIHISGSEFNDYCRINKTSEPYIKLLLVLLFTESVKNKFVTGTLDLYDIDPSEFPHEIEALRKEVHMISCRYSKLVNLQLLYSRLLRVNYKPKDIQKHLSDIERLLLDCPDDRHVFGSAF